MYDDLAGKYNTDLNFRYFKIVIAVNLEVLNCC